MTRHTFSNKMEVATQSTDSSQAHGRRRLRTVVSQFVLMTRIQCRKPTDNAFIESFNGKFRAECLNTHWFMSLEDAREKMEAWRRDYNEVRPHSAIGNKPPIELINITAAQSPP